MTTIYELLQQVAPEAVSISDRLDSQLLDKAGDIRQAAEKAGVWKPTLADVQYFDAGGKDPSRVLRACGFLGTGVTRDPEDRGRDPEAGSYIACMFVATAAPRLEISREPDGAVSYELGSYWSFLFEYLDIYLPNEPAFMIGLPEPMYFVGPGDPAYCNGPPGTFGAQVTTKDGARGILTAGHVAPIVGRSAYTVGTTYVGTVADSLDIVTLPPGDAGIDVAVIELLKSVPDTGIFLPGTLRTRPARIWDHLTGFGFHSLGRKGTVLAAGKYFAGPNRAHAHWLETALIQSAISIAGDSGGMVVDPSSSELIGHIVGGYPGVYSIVQDADAQLRAVGATLR